MCAPATRSRSSSCPAARRPTFRPGSPFAVSTSICRIRSSSTSFSPPIASSPGSRNPGLPVPVLVQPRHLDRLEDLLVGALGVVLEPRQVEHPAMEIGEADRQRVERRVVLAERDRDVLGVPPPDHFGISTTTLP